MAARNTADSRRFVYRPPDNNPESYFVSANRTGTQPIAIRSADSVTPRTEVSTPVRRVVVIKNTRNPQINRQPSDLNEFIRSNPPDSAPVFSDGVKISILNRIS